MACSNCARATLDIDELGADGFKLGVGLRHVHFGGHAAFEPALGQVELVFEVGDGGLSSLIWESRPRSSK